MHHLLAYTHHLFQVTSKIVKEIDKSLRKSEEIQEVYEEILKNTPKDHLVFYKV